MGCLWKGPRKELSEHIAICAFITLRPVLHGHADRLATLELENKALRRKIDILLPPRQPSEAAAPSFDEQTIQLLAAQEHLRSDVERLSVSLGEMEIQQSVLLMNESLRMKEEIAGLKAAIVGIRMQIHWLMTNRHQAAEQRSVGGGTSSGPQGTSTQESGIATGSALPGIRRMAGKFNHQVQNRIVRDNKPETDPPGDRVKL